MRGRSGTLMLEMGGLSTAGYWDAYDTTPGARCPGTGLERGRSSYDCQRRFLGG